MDDPKKVVKQTLRGFFNVLMKDVKVEHKDNALSIYMPDELIPLMQSLSKDLDKGSSVTVFDMTSIKKTDNPTIN